MLRTFLVVAMLVASLLLVTSCAPDANTSTANVNRAANTANNAAANTAASSAAIEAEIRKLVNDTAAALAKNDVATLERMYADNYMLVNLDGSVQNRTDRLASFRSGDTKFESFAYDEVSVRSNPEGTGAIVIARARAAGTNKGRPVTGEVRVTQVWRRHPDGWKQVTGHATQITAPATSPAANTGSAGNTGTTGSAANVNR